MNIYFFVAAFLAIYLFLSREPRSKKPSNIPVCYHCESKDTLAHDEKTNIFYCTFCDRVIDSSHVIMNHRQDFEMLKNHSEKYNEFKKARKEGKPYEIESNQNNQTS